MESGNSNRRGSSVGRSAFSIMPSIISLSSLRDAAGGRSRASAATHPNHKHRSAVRSRPSVRSICSGAMNPAVPTMESVGPSGSAAVQANPKSVTEHAPALVDEHVARLQVAMDHAVLRGRVQPRPQRSHDLGSLRHRNEPSAAQSGQIVSVDEVHHHEIATVGHPSQPMHRDNIGVMEAATSRASCTKRSTRCGRLLSRLRNTLTATRRPVARCVAA